MMRVASRTTALVLLGASIAAATAPWRRRGLSAHQAAPVVSMSRAESPIEGRPLVVIEPDVGLGADFWRPLANALAERGFDVAQVDRAGVGNARAELRLRGERSGSTAITRAGNRLAERVDHELGEREVFLVGIGFGALVAGAWPRPERVLGRLLIDPSCAGDWIKASPRMLRRAKSRLFDARLTCGTLWLGGDLLRAPAAVPPGLEATTRELVQAIDRDPRAWRAVCHELWTVVAGARTLSDLVDRETTVLVSRRLAAGEPDLVTLWRDACGAEGASIETPPWLPSAEAMPSAKLVNALAAAVESGVLR